MRLTKKLKTEILKVYNAYWDGYLQGDVRGMASLLGDDYTQVGSAETEVFDTKKGAVKFLRDTIDQVAGKLEMRNRVTRIEPQGNLVLVHELCDIYVLSDAEWMFYSKFRASTLMQKEKRGWKIVHQHSSFPDARTGEGENIATEKIAAENQKLREAVKRRTVELEQKGRELEIETALERVRAIAMGMNEPADMLEVCRTISLQLQSLGVKEIRNVQTAIFYGSRGTYMNYEYYARHKKAIVTETSYTNHQVHKAFATKMLKGKGEIFITHIKGNKVKDWIAYQKTTNVFIDRFLERASSLNYYWHSLGPVALGISTYVPLSKEDLGLFKRFLNVFELAYTRYLDIEQAHAQAREAQIETALERVRAVALGMKKAEELTNVCETLFVELRSLGFNEMRNTMINIHNDEKETFLNYDYSDEIGKSITPLFYSIHPVIEKQIKQIRSARDAFSETVFTGRDLESWKEFRRRSGEKDDRRIQTISALYYYFYSIGIGSIGMSSFSALSAEKLNLLKRFRNVFDFAYRRYMDVAQAEAQAREARIEAALERVRASAMSMHTSDELKQVGETIFSELKSLGFVDLRNTEILLNNDTKESVLSHYYSDYGVSGTIEVFYNDHPVVKKWANEMKKGSDAFAEIVIPEKEIGAWRKYREEIGYLPDPKLNAAKSVWYYSYSTGLGALSVSSFSPISEEQLRILERFRNVFGLAYRRYADVAQAEAQAREARIEAALERVRSRTMGMQRSDELKEAAALLFQQVQALGGKALSCGYNIWEEDETVVTSWMSCPRGVIRPPLRFPLTEDSFYKNFFRAKQRGEAFYVEEVTGKKLEDERKYLATVPGFQESLDASVKAGFPLPTLLIHHLAFFSQGFLLFITLEPCTELWDIFKRFAVVFEQTYTRFLDLKRAEAQAREAQIEASLERVRSRTLAMQKSDELAETAAVLFRQLITLGIEPNRLYIAIIQDDDGKVEFWITDEDGSKVSSGFAANLHSNRSFQKMSNGWQEGKKSITIDMKGEELEEYFKHLSSLSVPFRGGLSQKRRVQNIAYFSKGFIGMASSDEQPEETTALLERFAAVLNLTFTRFNDLKLAEAQAHQAHLDLIQLQTEKKRAEDALSELGATQAQLVQQEKLASLGQLTAGIAHEIKNPLNFVNNFSSLSVELVDEVMDEITKAAPTLGTGEVPHLLKNIKTNLTKIIEHGSRADGIVKSMLQHSRGGSSRMEPTDLNALIKEYVNLAFHGMRASKNPMNVDIVLDLDKGVGHVSMKAEDFSRVILNLCQNAFDAVREKLNSGDKRQASGSFLPKLTVRTRRENNRIAIQIEDNGPGIPDAIKDKVLQPFFTTKKGTQGTGLGLSITNDIVKAHGGEMRIETNGNGGATFNISLPTEIQRN